LDFSNFDKTHAIQIAILDANGEPQGDSRTIDLEGLWNSHNNNNNNNERDGYHISKGICRFAIVTFVSVFCILLLMATALVVLSVLLWEERKGGETGTKGVYEDDFYSNYFNNN
jgi:hypothetical protein